MLTGFVIGITADRRWDEQAALFERRGASVVHAPTIRTLPLGGDDRLRAATDDVIARPPQFVIANTGIGMRSWFGAAESWGVDAALLHALGGARILARGPKASAAVHTAGLEVEARARTERFAETVDLVVERLRPGQRVAVQSDGGGVHPDGERLRAAGAAVVDIPVYEWRLPDDPKPALRLAEAVIGRRVHAVTFTAAPQIRNWFALAAEADLEEPLRAALSSGDVVVGSVGHVCSAAAEHEGIAEDCQTIPAISRLGPLVRAVSDALVERIGRVPLPGGRELLLSGTVVRVGGGKSIELSDVEARLLAALADRSGAVVSKADLLVDVWGEPGGDPHVVEVAVGRLRRRLAPAGVRVLAVPRRGYRLA
ncbi:MAG: uroporphyrinogen-III synthase [Acidimicrobiales bacterium]